MMTDEDGDEMDTKLTPAERQAYADLAAAARRLRLAQEGSSQVSDIVDCESRNDRQKSGECCGDCRFFVTKATAEEYCRRFPPSPDYPLVGEDDWCGEWKAEIRGQEE